MCIHAYDYAELIVSTVLRGGVFLLRVTALYCSRFTGLQLLYHSLIVKAANDFRDNQNNDPGKQHGHNRVTQEVVAD